MHDRCNETLIAYRVADAAAMPLIPAVNSREWMKNTTDRFAQRCLPLLIANAAGWFITNAQTIHATWSGESDPRGLVIEYEPGEGPFAVSSHFGHGVLTWNLPYLFRTPLGINLLARGPSNWPKDGVFALEGLVETDWAVAPFTMNWKMTRPGLRVTFEAGEPICMLVPFRRGDLERYRPIIADIASNSNLAGEFQSWARSRARFLAALGSPGSDANCMRWQRDYFRGESPTGLTALQHQLKLHLRHFEEIAAAERKEQRFMPEDHTHPQVTKYVREISSKTRYPITNFGQLLKALGGENAEIEFEGWRAPAGRLKQFIPDHYFPVVSEEDLRRKSEELRMQHVQASGVEAGRAAAHADFSNFSARNKDVASVKLPKTEAQGGIAKFEEK